MLEIGSILAEPATWVILTITALFFLYRCGTKNFNTFSNQGIPGPKPIPFIGTMWGMWKQNMMTVGRENVKKYGNMYGSFEGTQPTLHVNDTEIIKSIFIKDFDHFINRRKFDMGGTKIFRYMLTSLEDQPWKDVRSAVSPTFTSGKIKQYSVQIKECADQRSDHFHKIAENQGKIELKEEISILTMSIIAKCAFGMTIDNLGAENDPFIKKAKLISDPPGLSSPFVLLLFILPSRLLGWMGKKFFPMEAWQFFYDIMETMAKERLNNPQKYHDFPEMTRELITAYTKEVNGKKVPMWDGEEIDELVTAQAVLFMVAGYSTTSYAITSSLFLLARHPEVQEKLYDLIMNKMDQHGDVCHEMIQDIPYLDQVMNEVMRMYPAAPALERMCNKDITYNGIHINKGMLVSVSPHALHYSEDYYTDPETFDPDRWSPENKANLNPYAFMPFGLGPRNCVAMRFAQEEVKLILSVLVKQFRFFPVEETPLKITCPPGIGSLDPVNSTVGISARL